MTRDQVARRSPNVRIRLFLHFVEKFIEGAVTPFFVIFLSQRLGAFQVGVMLAVALGISAAMSLVGGHMADTRKRRDVLAPVEIGKTVALVLLCGMLGVMEQRWELYLVFLLYFLVTLGNSVAAPVCEALVLDAVAPAEMRKVYADLYWITNFARSAGTVIGVVLYDISFTWLVALAAGFSAVGALLVLFRLQDRQPALRAQADAGPGSGTSMVEEYRRVLSDRLMLAYVAASALNFSIAVQLANYVAVRLAEEFPSQVLSGLGAWQPVVTGVVMFGVLRLETNLIAIALTGPMQALTRNVSQRLLFGIAPLVAGGAFAVLFVSNDAWVLVLAMAVYTFAELLYSPAKMALISRLAPPDARSRYAAVRAFDFRIALVVGAACVATIHYIPSWVMAGLMFVAGLLVSALLRHVDWCLTQRELAQAN